LALPAYLFSQSSAPPPAYGAGLVAVASNAAVELPEAPGPQFALAEAEPAGQQTATGQDQGTPPPQPAQGSAPDQGASSSQAPAPQPGAQQSQHDKAAAQVKEQEQQRVVGILPAFNVSYRSDAVSLSAGQKMSLAFRSSVDPFTFAAAFMVAGYHEALDEDTGFGWGIEGYGKRSGAAYLDAFNGTMIGNGILPAIFRQDPRYFRLGHGTFSHRLLYAIATSYICKHDNSGRWEPNYSNVGGNIIAGAISNLYYPSQNSGWSQTISNGFIVTTEGTIGGVFQEFWPDISRKLFHKDPTHGLDAQAAAADKAGQTPPPQQSPGPIQK
jgi:hypothetical protein